MRKPQSYTVRVLWFPRLAVELYLKIDAAKMVVGGWLKNVFCCAKVRKSKLKIDDTIGSPVMKNATVRNP
jgi:hypothetical protein